MLFGEKVRVIIVHKDVATVMVESLDGSERARVLPSALEEIDERAVSTEECVPAHGEPVPEPGACRNAQSNERLPNEKEAVETTPTSHPYVVEYSGVKVHCATVEAAHEMIKKLCRRTSLAQRLNESSLTMRVLRLLASDTSRAFTSAFIQRALALTSSTSLGGVPGTLRKRLGVFGMTIDDVLVYSRESGVVRTRSWKAGPRIEEALQHLQDDKVKESRVS